MALGLVTTVAGERARRYSACALLLLLAAVIQPGPGFGQDSDEAYSATVKVDATAENTAAARELARIDGQRRALAAVLERLSGSSDAAKPPKLDDKTITGMVDSFEVANERMSAVRYIADYTFHFRPSKVRRLVRVADTASPEGENKGTAEIAPKPPPETANRAVIVLPVYQDGSTITLWDDPNAWRTAWAQRPAGRLTVPLGDAGDLAAIDAERAGSGNSEALASIAQRNGGSETVVALATARHQGDRLAGLDVSIKRYRSGRLVDAQGSSYEAGSGEGEAEFVRRAADAVAGEIEIGTKKTAGQRSDQQTSLAVTVPITSLGDWLQIRDRLTTVAAIRKVDLLSLSRQEAKIEVKYVGTQDQLKSGLAGVNLDLDGGNPVWRLRPSGQSSSR